MSALMELLVAHNPDTGMEHSYAEKCLICRKQVQLRKKLDHLTKVGETKLKNHSQDGLEDPLAMLLSDLALIMQHETTHGIPKTKPPVRLVALGITHTWSPA